MRVGVAGTRTKENLGTAYPMLILKPEFFQGCSAPVAQVLRCLSYRASCYATNALRESPPEKLKTEHYTVGLAGFWLHLPDPQRKRALVAGVSREGVLLSQRYVNSQSTKHHASHKFRKRAH